jgi:MoaA/NifB/PqqE/SkfB family radical SAM enzyme
MVRSPGPELSTDELKRFIDQVIELGAVSIGLAEGDPLLRDDTVELVRYVNKERSTVSIFTPGLLLTEDLAEELKKAGLYAVIIGFCSPIASEHDKIRKLKGAFRKAGQSIKNALQAGIFVSMHCHANPWLVDTGRLEGLYKLARELGVHEFTVWESIPTWYYRGKEEIMLNGRHREYLLSMYRRINSSPVGPRMFLMTFFEGPDFLGCMAGRRWLNLVDSGDITPCIYTPISFGNIKEEKVSTIWDRIRKHPQYKQPKPSCMMLDSGFRKRYIEKIPEGTWLPIRIEELEKILKSETCNG